MHSLHSWQMDALIYRDDERRGGGRHRYLVEPISGQLRVVMNTSDVPDLLNPKMVFEMAIDQIWVSLNEAQFRSIQELAESYVVYFRVRRYLQFRPDLRPRAAPGAARAWWGYIRNTIVADIKRKRYRWSWEYLKSRKEARVEYVRLWRLHKFKKTKPEEEKRIEALEEKWDLEDIMLFRSLAEALVRRDKKAQAAAKAQAGWFGGWFGGGTAAAAAEENLSTEDWQRLFTAIDFQESKPLPVSVPPELVKMRAIFRLASTGVKLINYADGRELVAGSLNGIEVSADMRPLGSISCAFALQSMRVMDAYSVPDRPIAIVHSAKATERQLAGTFDIKPLNRSEDMVVQATAQALHATLARPLLDRMVVFFSHRSAALEQLQMAAFASIDQLQQEAATRIKYALDKKKVISISLDLAAPVLHVPQSLTDENAPTLIVSLGMLELRSDHSARDAADRQQKQLLAQDPSVQISEDYFYDRFKVRLSGISSQIETRQAAPTGEHKHRHKATMPLIDPFEFQLDMRLCTAASPLLPKIVLNASLPELAVHLNAWSISTLLAIAENAVKNTLPAPAAVVAPVPSSTSSLARASQLATVTTAVRKRSGALLRPEEEEAKLIRADFSISKASVMLERRTRDGDGAELLIDLTVADVGVHFEKMRTRMEASVRVGACEIRDGTPMYRAHPQFSYLIKSHALDGAQQAAATKPAFIWLRFEQVDKLSRKYAGIDNQVELLLGRLTFNFNQETLVSVAETVFGLQALLAKSSAAASASAAAADAATSAAAAAAAALPDTGDEEVFTLAKVRIAMTRAEVVLHRNGASELLAVAGVERLAMGLEILTNRTLMVAGELGAVVVTDLTTSGSTHPNWRDLVRLPWSPAASLLHSQSVWVPPRSPQLSRSFSQLKIDQPNILRTSFTMASSQPPAAAAPAAAVPPAAAAVEEAGVTWSFRTFKSRDESEFGVDMAARAEVGRCRVLVVWRLLTTLLSTVLDFNKMLQAVMPKPTAASAPAALPGRSAAVAAGASKLLKYEVVVSNPTTMIVGNEREANAGYLALDFGRVFLSNSFGAASAGTDAGVPLPEHIELVVQDLEWRTRAENEQKEAHLLERFSTVLLLDREQDRIERRMRVKIELGEIRIRVSEKHVQVKTNTPLKRG